MPYLGPDIAVPEALKPVNLKKKIRNRFYEPIILLHALTQFCMNNNALKTQEPASNVALQNSEQLFHDFMNKLAQICDSNRGGATVTANVALMDNEGVEYRFASNRRTEAELKTMEGFIEEILSSLKTWTPENSAQVKARVLQKIVAFNHLRLRIYVQDIYNHSQECIDSPANTIPAQTIEKLKDLRSLSLKANDRNVDENVFFVNCTHLALKVKRLSKSETYGVLRDKANKNGQDSPWGRLRHAAGRLLSYYQVVNTLVEARRQWDRLFYDYRIVCLPSSSEIHNPISRKNVTPEEIIGRMTAETDKQATFNEIVQELKKFDVEGKVRSQTRNKDYRLTVHAEILIEQSIVNDPDVQSLHPTKFFEGYKYIGSSKPTCRLCHYYFQASDSIQVRPTHNNLYINWKAPDVYRDQGDVAVKRRERIINKMIEPIREVTFRTLNDKAADSKRFDTHTDPTYDRGTSLGYNELPEEITEALRQVRVDDSDVDDHASLQVSQGSMEPGVKDSDDDYDDGGVKLS